MPYLVMEFVDRDFQIVETKREAQELADYYQEGITEYADCNGEWPAGSKIIIAEIIKESSIEQIGDTEYFEMKIEEFKEVQK